MKSLLTITLLMLPTLPTWTLADDDAGKGAAYGAAAGLIAGRRQGKSQQAQAQQQTQAQAQQAQQATQRQMDNFKKAFSACMEGKNYIAKF